jgi:hypothetical protein
MVERLLAAPGAELEVSDELTAAAEACVADVGG